MAVPEDIPRFCYRFGPFEADVEKGELRKGGVRIRLQRKPWQILVALLKRHGQTVTRSEIEKRLWPEGVYVDFEHGVNVAVKKLREALLDSASEPRYIETVAGEGYRFIGRLQQVPLEDPVCIGNGEPSTFKGDAARAASARGVASPGSNWGWLLRRWGAGLALALTLVITGSRHVRRALPFQERDWVLIEGFENRTGDALFEGVLPAALERELSNSEFVNVAPRERVEDALRLMRRPVDSSLNTAEARQVCLRDGGIRALVTGRTEKLGSTYLLSVEILNPFSGLTVAADTETASQEDQVWPAVRRLSNWVRQTLGETMERIDRSNRQLEKVTTPSLRALQLFTEADSASRRGQWAVSAQLTRQVLVEDPDFASAHLWLAWALNNLRDDGWKAELQRALALISTVSERERYFILGSYESMMGHPDQAVSVFEALIRRYPDHYFAYRNLQGLYRRLGKSELAADIAARLADAKPNDPAANSTAAFYNQTINLARARKYAQRAADVGAESGDSFLSTNTLFFHAHDLWMQDDAKGALTELQRIAAQYNNWSDPKLGPQATLAAASIYLTLGKFQTSQQMYDSLGESSRIPHTYVSFFQSGDWGDARQHAAVLPSDWQQRGSNLWDRLLQGEVSLIQGRFTEAASLLQTEFNANYRQRFTRAQLTGDALATALEQAGDFQKALSVLEAVSATRIWIVANGAPPVFYGAFWLRDQARLSTYYHRLGREPEARRIDNQLRKLLAVADPTHPILRQLAGR